MRQFSDSDRRSSTGISGHTRSSWIWLQDCRAPRTGTRRCVRRWRAWKRTSKRLSTTGDRRAHNSSTRSNRIGRRARTRMPRWNGRGCESSWTECRWTRASRYHLNLRPQSDLYQHPYFNRDRALDTRSRASQGSIRCPARRRRTSKQCQGSKDTRTSAVHPQRSRLDQPPSIRLRSPRITQASTRHLRRRTRRRFRWVVIEVRRHHLLTRQRLDTRGINHSADMEHRQHLNRRKEDTCLQDSSRHLLPQVRLRWDPSRRSIMEAKSFQTARILPARRPRQQRNSRLMIHGRA